MVIKSVIRKKFLKKRKKKYFDLDSNFFNPLLDIILKKKINNFKLGIYFPAAYELNVLAIFRNRRFSKFKFFFPVINDKDQIEFHNWSNQEILFVNKYGILEPEKKREITPNFILVPLLAFDKNKYRLGYGKGYYDRYLNKINKKKRNIVTIGVAFSFQRHHKLPVNENDYKLDYILTEEGIIK